MLMLRNVFPVFLTKVLCIVRRLTMPTDMMLTAMETAKASAITARLPHITYPPLIPISAILRKGSLRNSIVMNPNTDATPRTMPDSTAIMPKTDLPDAPWTILSTISCSLFLTLFKLKSRKFTKAHNVSRRLAQANIPACSYPMYISPEAACLCTSLIGSNLYLNLS